MRTAFTFYFVTVLFANTLTAMWISIHIPYLSAFSIRQCFFSVTDSTAICQHYHMCCPCPWLWLCCKVGTVYWNPLHTEKAFHNLCYAWIMSYRWVEELVTIFLGIIGIVTQATRAASIVLSAVFGARLPSDNEQWMSLTPYLHIVQKRPSLSHLREP